VTIARAEPWCRGERSWQSAAVNRAPVLLALVAFVVQLAACGSSSPAPARAPGWSAGPAQQSHPRLVVDASGGHHVASATPSYLGARPIQYGYCAAACDSPASWTYIVLGELGPNGGSVDLVVTPDGRPRLLWLHSDPTRTEYWYDFCDAANCADGRNWTGPVALVAAADGPRVARYLALSPEGLPRFAFADATASQTGTYYATCQAEPCQVSGNWTFVTLSATPLAGVTLASDAAGRVRVAAQSVATTGVDWFQCDAGCASASSWTASALPYALGDGGIFALALDGSGGSRLALYQGGLGGDSHQDQLYFAACDGDCSVARNWTATAIGLAQFDGVNGVGLALDGAGRPRIAYGFSSNGSGVGVATCDGGCATSAGGWTHRVVETRALVDEAEPRPLPAGATGNGWITVGRAPSVALDATGNPRLAFGAEHASWQADLQPSLDEFRIRLVVPR
jgi:hypothetical protein